MPLQGRKYQASNRYRYGFNGKENDPETVGTGSGTQDYGFRIYNPALGRFLSVDPLSKEFPWYSPYHYAGNSPIVNIDLDGLEDVSIHKNIDKTTTMTIKYKAKDIVALVNKQTPEKRIIYSKDGSSEEKKTSQFEGPGKAAQKKLFDLKAAGVKKLAENTLTKTGVLPSEGKASGIIPAPVIERKSISGPNEDSGEKESPKEVKYVVFDINVTRDELTKFDKNPLKDEYIKSIVAGYKKEGYEEVDFGKLNVVDKPIESYNLYKKDGSSKKVVVYPTTVETGTRPSKKK